MGVSARVNRKMRGLSVLLFGLLAALKTAKKICSQVASPLERFGSFARVRPFFASRRQDHANNILSLLQSGGDLSNVGSLWRNKRDTFDFDNINRFSDGNGILNPDEDDILEFLGQSRTSRATLPAGWAISLVSSRR